MLLAIGVFIASISLLVTFVGNLETAQSTTMGTSWLEDTGDDQTGTDTTEEEEETEQSRSLNIEGLSRQGADDLAIVCMFFPERC
jgi:1,4-dihydroxy-2-naphthoate octaprenyltransferase